MTNEARSIKTRPQDKRHAGRLECAGKAQRRRRFAFAGAPRRASQSGVALRLPPHSKAAGAANECSQSHGPLSKGRKTEIQPNPPGWLPISFRHLKLVIPASFDIRHWSFSQ